jgi:hypothetical protein
VRPEHRGALLSRLWRAIRDGDLALPRLEVHRAEHARLSGQGRWAHLDDQPRELAGDVEVRVQPAAVSFFVPR